MKDVALGGQLRMYGVAVVLFVLSGCAGARYDTFDLDGDEYLSEIELSAAVFGMWDSGGDGLLQHDEWQAGISMDPQFEEWGNEFSAWDQNEDGRLSKNEFDLGFGASDTFSDWDTDNNGLLDDDELAETDLFRTRRRL